MESDESIADAASARSWYVLHVKPRTERKVVARLRALGGFHHLPVYVKVTRVQRRKVRRELPLFPGYVFAHLSPAERAAAFRSNLLVRTIPIPRPRETIHQLRQIAHAARAAEDLAPVRRLYRAGETVRVKYGPLRGTVGCVKRRGAAATLCLNVEILGACVELSIDPADLEPYAP